ncbi:lysozyme inhibitor LprI family protein [Burkholderia sp. LAS2]|uniref:lysozyme inhibitor LprI family protein n=1 Tax=Burkholderia sp. LAS2 TaxID=2813843 RepID=UPI00201B7513|nr:lysozyme inhibitor LprI family protein [Burkholderia sp. LAS2]
MARSDRRRAGIAADRRQTGERAATAQGGARRADGEWKKARDTSCEKSARHAWGDGSMRPAAQAICATAATKEMVKRLSARASRKPS